MESRTRASWALLALVHATPAAVLFAPALATRLYGVDPQGELGVLIVHRGALFAALVAACAIAVFDVGARRVASVAVAISVVGFLGVFARAGGPEGALRTIAAVDAAALVPLAWVLWTSWRPVR